MARIVEMFSELNKFLRTLLAIVVVAGLGYAGGWVYHNVLPDGRLRQREQQLNEVRTALAAAQEQLAGRDATIQQLNAHVAAAEEHIARLDTSLRLLKVDRRLADIVVLNQTTDPRSGRLMTEIGFQEIDNDGNPIDQAKRFAIEGDVVYLDHWIVKFDDQYVEQADVDRAMSICLFRRVFGEYQNPNEGYVLDEIGSRPKAYGTAPMSEFERGIWDDFWNIANDPDRARELGIRGAHGDAVFIQVRPAARYRVTLRASGGLTINRVE